MNSRTIIFVVLALCFASALAGRPEPEPEPEFAAPLGAEGGECDMRPRNHKECEEEARLDENCTRCVTSKCKACREVFNRFCTRPAPVQSVEACLRARCSTKINRRFKDKKTLARCRSGMKRLCERHVCVARPLPAKRDDPEPEPMAEPLPVEREEEGACDLRPRSHRDCDEEARLDENCTRCVTSKCKACREVFNRFCTRPQRVTSVEACLRARCSTKMNRRFKDKKYLARCRSGMKRLCEKHVCQARPLPVERVDPEPEPEPVVNECELKPRGQKDCLIDAELDENCTDCVTGKCKACRAIFVRFCLRPEPVQSVEACLRARCSTKMNKNFRHKKYLARCRQGLRAQCAKHAACAEQEQAKPLPVQKVDPEPAVLEPKPKVCQLRPRSAKDCEAEARLDENCTRCVTSKCKACRQVFNRFCQRPERVASVEQCLATRCSAKMNRRFKSKKYWERCVRGLRRQCEQHAAACEEEEPVKVVENVVEDNADEKTVVKAVIPEPEPEPVAPLAPQPDGTCDLAARPRAICDKESFVRCGACVTSKCKACRQVYTKFCQRPEPVTDVESCLRARCSKKSHKWMKTERHIKNCRLALANQCAEQMCQNIPKDIKHTGTQPLPVRQPPRIIERIVEKTVVKPQIIVIQKAAEATCEDRCPECEEIKSLLASVESITATVDLSLESVKCE